MLPKVAAQWKKKAGLWLSMWRQDMAVIVVFE